MAPLVAFALLVLAGCVGAAGISPDIQPDVAPGVKYPASAALVCSEKMQTFTERFTVPTDSRSDRQSDGSYYFKVGEPLCNALARSVGTAYGKPVVVPARPPLGSYERVFDFTVQSSRLVLPPNFSTVSAEAIRYNLFLTMEAYDGKTMGLIKRTTVEGIGRPAGGRVWGWIREPLVSAVEAGIQDVSTNTAQLLAAGFAESQ